MFGDFEECFVFVLNMRVGELLTAYAQAMHNSYTSDLWDYLQFSVNSPILGEFFWIILIQ
jgi:hypothetical protein